MITRIYNYRQIRGNPLKTPCRVSTTTSILLTGIQTIDGILLVSGDRVLVKDQGALADNGIWIAGSGAWSRALDASSSSDFFKGILIYITNGTSNGGKTFYLSTDNPITLGSTGLTFNQWPNSLVSNSNPIGYTTGAGGTTTQLTSKSNGVTIDKVCGTITMDGSILNAGTIVSFTVTNSYVTSTDVVFTQHDSGGTIGAYTITANTMTNGAFNITVRNNTAVNLSEAIVIRFAIIKAVIA